ncbi:MAG: hypothetical protein Q8K75_08460 [Chlamydiales bacterium]|nr:hypothetical protein [Chlamydiales bacterium]
MADFALTVRGAQSWVPILGSPTVALARCVEHCRDKNGSWFQRQVVSRSACVAAVGTAMLESSAHILMSAGTCSGVVGRIMIRAFNRFIAGAVAAVWGMVYGGMISLNVTVWLRRIIINVVLFSRDISIAWEHWMERRVAATDLLWLSTRLWAMAFRVDTFMRQGLNMTRVAHHANQSWHYLVFAAQNAAIGVTSPDELVKSCKDHQLGKGMPPRSLATRIWKVMMRHKWKTMVLTFAACAAMDYAIRKPDNFQEYLTDSGNRAMIAGGWLMSHSFGILVDVKHVLASIKNWVPKDLELKELQIDNLKLDIALKKNQLKAYGEIEFDKILGRKTQYAALGVNVNEASDSSNWLRQWLPL